MFVTYFDRMNIWMRVSQKLTWANGKTTNALGSVSASAVMAFGTRESGQQTKSTDMVSQRSETARGKKANIRITYS